MKVQTGNTTKPEHLQEEQYKGIPSSDGISIGKAVVLKYEPVILSDAKHLPTEQLPAEHERFAVAISVCMNEMTSIINIAYDQAPSAAAILEAQLMIVGDIVVHDSIHIRISQGYSAEVAVAQEFDMQEQFLKMAKDQILRERAVDLEQVKQRLIAILRHEKTTHSIPKNSVIIANFITPADVITCKEAGMLGFVMELSGIASHVSIMARTMRVPAVIGLRNITQYIENGAEIIVDGFSGLVITNPKPETLAKYEKKIVELETKRKRLGKYAKLPSQTTDGKKIHLFANADTEDEISEAIASGAEGIGLVRTEYLVFKLKHFPTEEQQTAWYTELAERAYPLPLTLRAFDVGSDKVVDAIPHEPNPALGLRGLRFLSKRHDLFRNQIRAILRASKHRNIRFLLPMVSSVSEVIAARELLLQCKIDLRKESIEFDENMPFGIMIETPSSAIMANDLAVYSDFFSIGTNDLTQYTLAADRINPAVTDIFDSFNPAVLRLIKMAADAAKYRNIPIEVCGEMAGHSAATELFIGLGIDELSVVPQLLLELKKRVRQANYQNSVKLADDALHYTSGTEIRKLFSAIKKQ